MMNLLRVLFAVVLICGLTWITGCGDDDDDTTSPPETDEWVGTWLSAGENVAPILVAVFNYDSVRVEFDEDQIVTLDSHVAGGAWTSVSGTYLVTRYETGDIHSIETVYPAFSQEGIIQVISANPDTMKLEVVQTVPDIGAIPRTPETGFGSDLTLGDLNIQIYLREE